MTPTEPARAGQEFSGTLVRTVLQHVASALGPATLDTVLAAAGEPRPVAELFEDARWHSYDQFRALLEAAADALGGAEHLAELGDHVGATASSMPDLTDAAQALGGPSELLRQVRHGANGISTVIVDDSRQVGPTEWEMRTRMAPGYEPFRAFCHHLRGLNGQVPRLFGMRVVELSEEACELRGDPWCVTRLRWAPPDQQSELAFARSRIGVLERRIASLQETVLSLAAHDDLETMLTQVVTSASRATRAPALVLALDPAPWASRRVFSLGVHDEEAERFAAQILAGQPVPGMVVDVASAEGRHGRLAALDFAGSLPAHDQAALEGYARLAATALDSAVMVAEARRQAAAASAVLDLSRRLAETASTEEMAVHVARAMPAVIRCNRSLVLLFDGEVARVAASHGFDAAVAADIAGAEVSVAAHELRRKRTITAATATPVERRYLRSTGVRAMASAPIDVDGEVVGALVAGETDRPELLLSDPFLGQQFSGLAGQVAAAIRSARLLERIRHQALHDTLTGLPNRSLILDRADRMLARGRRDQTSVAALYVDLDGFKQVNDTLGHPAGDALLCAVAERLSTALRDSDTIARLGGDEFVVLVEGPSLDGGPELVAGRILDLLRTPFHLAGVELPVTVSASVGVAVGDRATAGELLRDADIALYEAKAAGRSCARVFAPEMHRAAQERIQLERDLRSALEREELVLRYQPIVDLATRRVRGVEALLRWDHPSRGLLGPDVFIPLLEEIGQIGAVGRWVLDEACRQGRALHDAGHRVTMTVNVSADQLADDALVGEVDRALHASGFPAGSLALEITETAIMRDADAAAHRLEALRALGVRIAIDDFGTGYSSLAYLRQFPVDTLKIDQSFVRSVVGSPESGAIIAMLTELGRTLGLETLAEGVEDLAQVAALRAARCEAGQGYLFARPLTPSSLAEYLAAHSTADPRPTARA